MICEEKKEQRGRNITENVENYSRKRMVTEKTELIIPVQHDATDP